jgi:hypothetical protein
VAVVASIPRPTALTVEFVLKPVKKVRSAKMVNAKCPA